MKRNTQMKTKLKKAKKNLKKAYDSTKIHLNMSKDKPNELNTFINNEGSSLTSQDMLAKYVETFRLDKDDVNFGHSDIAKFVHPITYYKLTCQILHLKYGKILNDDIPEELHPFNDQLQRQSHEAMTKEVVDTIGQIISNRTNGKNFSLEDPCYDSFVEVSCNNNDITK